MEKELKPYCLCKHARYCGLSLDASLGIIAHELIEKCPCRTCITNSVCKKRNMCSTKFKSIDGYEKSRMMKTNGPSVYSGELLEPKNSK